MIRHTVAATAEGHRLAGLQQRRLRARARAKPQRHVHQPSNKKGAIGEEVVLAPAGWQMTVEMTVALVKIKWATREAW